jgi:hypothetical protein
MVRKMPLAIDVIPGPQDLIRPIRLTSTHRFPPVTPSILKMGGDYRVLIGLETGGNENENASPTFPCDTTGQLLLFAP